jgi:NHLM bacteriocin system ABC transporter peptidase/ATP-binding protein
MAASLTQPKPGQMARKVPQIMQMEALECGAACLDMICAYWGKWVPLEKCRTDCGVSRDGSSALNVVKAARSYGLDARGYRYEPEELRERGLFPCICHVGFNHFIVVRGFRGDKVFVNDPARGETKLSLEEFDKTFTGVALQFFPTEDFVQDGERASVKEFALARLKGASAAMVFVALTSAIAAALNAVSPIMSQIFLDSLLTTKHPDWFAPFMVMLVAFGVVQVTISALNAIYLLRVEGKMSATSNSSFLWKLLHMPMEFFSQRMAGDIMQRMSTNATIAQTIVSQLAPLLVNAVMLVVYLWLMVTYSPLLATVGILSVLVQLVCARLISKRRVNATRVSMRDSANLSSTTMNGISMIDTLKAQGVEPGFFRRWAGFQASVNSQSVKMERETRVLGMMPSIVSTVCNAAVLGLGVWLILAGEFTSGALLSMQSLISQFSAPAQSFIGVMQSFQELRTDMERIKDVMDYPEDPLARAEEADAPTEGMEKLKGEVELKNVTFGYSRLGKPVVKDFSIHVRPGGCIALVGASGCGKSTIAKIVSGLYMPWEGEVLVDGKPLAEVPRAIRTSSIAVIDQDIVLFHDTISNNIRLWDSSIEDYEVILAARDAGIHDVIMSRPDGYDHVLSEGGKDLSGGQRQRVEIARALAMDPTILVMDEATSALDAQTEAEVMSAVRKRGITLIVIAHRLSTVRDADEIVVFENGGVAERGTHEELYAAGGAYTRLVSQE